MSSKMSQKEYLKKYLSGGSDKKKKKKDKKSKSRATVKIIDDDLHASNNVDNDEELFLTGEDAPQIVGIVDAFGETAESKWKRIGDVKKEEDSDGDMWGKKAPNIGSTNQSPVRKRSPKAKFTCSSDKANNLAPTGISSDQSPSRKESGRKHHGNGSDLLSTTRSRDSVRSPERKSSSQNSKRSSEQSPPRRRQLSPRSRKDSDQSPPRKQTSTRLRKDSDQSPPRRQTTSRLRRDTDQSPPRRLTSPRSKTDSDQSPQRKRPAQRLRPNSDQSPDRRRLRKNSDSSPQSRQSSTFQIKREKSNDQSPPRRRNNGNPFKSSVKIEKPSPDNSPQRYRPHPNSDKSPSRSRLEARSDSPPPSHKPKSKMTTTLDGKRAGLQDAKTLKSETEERRRNEDKMFSKMSKEVSGKDAEVQVRQNSSYRRRRRDIEEDPEVQRKKAEHEEKKKELYTRWNKGVKQLEAHEAKMSDDQYESSKPLARYSNDADLDEMLRQKEHQDDPMLEYMRNKKKDQQLAANIPVMPKYKGLYPENRYGIPPGYRWDGVDRSNGYEKKWFDAQSHKEALAEDAYKYSVEDM